MKRRHVLLVASVAAMLLANLAAQKKPEKLLVLDWAARSHEPAPPVAVLVEMGLKDAVAKDWSGQAVVRGARVVHREGYRFRKGDELVGSDGWKASSHRPLRGAGQMPKAVAIVLDPIATVGVVLHLSDVQPDATLALTAKEQEVDVQVPLKEVLAGKPQLLADGRVAVRLVSTAAPVAVDKTEDDFPAACYGPDGTLWLAYIAYHVKEDSRRIEPPQLPEQPKDFKSYYDPSFGDQLLVKYYRNGKWSEPIAITDNQQDLVRCAIAAAPNGEVIVAYSAQRGGNFDIFVRSLKIQGDKVGVGPEQQRTRSETPDLAPQMCTVATGEIWLGFQHWDPKSGCALSHSHHYVNGVWHESAPRQGPAANDWFTTVTSGPSNRVATVTDRHLDDYDLEIHELEASVQGGQASHRLLHKASVASSSFEGRPAACYDPAGRLWIAYEEGPEQWGKDFGALDTEGNPLYFARTVKVVCLVDGKLMRPVAELPPLAVRAGSPDTGQKVEAIPRYAYPKIGIDGKGRLWVTYRQKFGTRYTTHPGSYWLTLARRLDGDRWSEPIEVHHSDGLLDDRPVLLPHPAGGLRIIHNTDGRFTTPDVIDNQVYMSYIDLPGEPVEPKLVAHQPGQKDPKLLAKAKKERVAVERIRQYRIEAGGKKLQLLRGEFHRHTEVSWDGGPDGSLEDMFRYGIDAAALDWIGNGDHDNGAGREYSWWLTQKLTDAYHVKERFTPMFTYERSVSYPHGHRNCMFAQRGVRTLPRLAEPDPAQRVAGIHADDTKMLYRYLKEHNGICAVHTSATSMGTDWRDNDPVAEPIVEIYQGDRMSYEKEEAPRAGYDPKSGKKPANIAGWYPLGFINLALDKGYRLGFQASSDHFSTHISYCVALAERHDRQAILDALKRRHCYGATDNIILDVKSGPYIMGDEFPSSQPPGFDIAVIGTAPLARIDILKDSNVVDTIRPSKAEYKGSWVDPKPTAGTHYYYVRVLQEDEELAWSSPMWIHYAK
jgi:hypothetical protein